MQMTMQGAPMPPPPEVTKIIGTLLQALLSTLWDESPRVHSAMGPIRQPIGSLPAPAMTFAVTCLKYEINSGAQLFNPSMIWPITHYAPKASMPGYAT